ncbi:putative MFS transporter [Saccharopolyspora spinosa]|uniref:MFS transporter n=1 Tax=Saccharopolyspora spinosa TaxID=60894 RepID=A0A2N3Y1M8_SACSN|nr:putative MFS transporter [Saccharopolyspora spinosa]
MSQGQTAVPASLNLAGYVLGAYLGVLADRIGRRRALIIAILIQGPASLLTGLSWDVASFTIFRALTGIGTGALLAIVVTYIAELAPGAKRGRYTQYAIVFAGVSHAVTGLVGAGLVALSPGYGWRALFAVGAMILLLLPVMAVLRLPESPRWLVLRGRGAEADVIVSRWEHSLGRDHLLPVPEPAPSEPASDAMPVRQLLRRPYLGRLVVVLAYWLIWYLWVYGFLGFSSLLFVDMGHAPTASVLYVALGELGALASTALPLFLVDRVERKYLITAMLVMGGSGLLVIATSSGATGLIVGSLITIAVTSGGSLAFGYTAEIFPTQARASGMAVADGFGHLSGVVAPMLVVGLVGTVSARGIFGIWAALAFAGGLLILAAGRRTQGTLTEVAR